MIDSESLFFAITGVGPLEGESAFEFSSFPLFFREPMIVKPLDRIKHGGVVDENRSRLQRGTEGGFNSPPWPASWKGAQGASYGGRIAEWFRQ
jgi:hypothetical protein